MINRRHLLRMGIAGSTTLAFGAAWSQSAPSLGTPALPEPGFRRFQVGAATVIALNDAVIRRPLGDDFVRNTPLDSVKAALAAEGLSTDYIDVPYNAYLVLLEGRKILIDTGFADNGPPTSGRLRANLALAGLSPADIDTVLISHFHGDHIQGLRDKQGSLVFPNAKVHVPAPEFAFWMDDARMEAAAPAARGGFAVARRVFRGMGSDSLIQFEPGQAPVPGIESAVAHGHSPGQTVFTVRSQGQVFTYVADVAHYPALFVRNPDWQVMFDMNPELARQTRRQLLTTAAADGRLVGGYHFPFPGVGKIAADGDRFRFNAA